MLNLNTTEPFPPDAYKGFVGAYKLLLDPPPPPPFPFPFPFPAPPEYCVDELLPPAAN